MLGLFGEIWLLLNHYFLLFLFIIYLSLERINLYILLGRVRKDFFWKGAYDSEGFLPHEQEKNLRVFGHC